MKITLFNVKTFGVFRSKHGVPLDNTDLEFAGKLQAFKKSFKSDRSRDTGSCALVNKEKAAVRSILRRYFS